VEGFYTSILDSLGLLYGLWDHEVLGSPKGNFLTSFPIVIWLCEWAFPSLNFEDREAIREYLDNGGNLFISGQDIGWDLADPTGRPYNQYSEEAVSFFNDYLHADYIADDSEDQSVTGVIGDPIGDGLTFDIYQPGRIRDFQFPEVIAPRSGASEVFKYSSGDVGAIKFAGGHRVVYFGFGFEAIDSKESTLPTEFSSIRALVMQRVLNWLNNIVHVPLKDTEDIAHPYPVTATITGDISDLTAVDLYWKKEGESSFTKVPMSQVEERRYSADIPAAGEVTAIYYYIQTENPYFKWQSPPGAPAVLHRFYVGPDTVKPMITHQKLPNTMNGEEPFYVLVSATDNIEVDTAAVYLHYITKEAEDSLKLSPTGRPDQFDGFIPPVASYGDTVNYFFTAKDMASVPNIATSDTFAFVVGLEDFESGLTCWDVEPGGWGLETLFAHSGGFSVNDSPGKSYANNVNTSLTMNFGMDLSSTDAATLFFWTLYFLEENKDFGYVEVSTDGGNTWEQLGEAITGVKAPWVQESRSLTKYTGPGFNDVRIRFRMTSNSTQATPLFGWFIDDIKVVEGLEVSVEMAEISHNVPRVYSLSQNYPNPFNPFTEIQYQLPKASKVTIKVFNLLGQEIRTLVDEYKKAGCFIARWDGKDAQGREVPSGIYFCKLQSEEFQRVRKMVLIR